MKVRECLKWKDGYEWCGNSPLANNEKDDCFVKAVANAFEVRYEKAHKFVKVKFNRIDRKATMNVSRKMENISQFSNQKIAAFNFNPKKNITKIKLKENLSEA
jgi:hypothetical protein